MILFEVLSEQFAFVELILLRRARRPVRVLCARLLGSARVSRSN